MRMDHRVPAASKGKLENWRRAISDAYYQQDVLAEDAIARSMGRSAGSGSSADFPSRRSGPRPRLSAAPSQIAAQ